MYSPTIFAQLMEVSSSHFLSWDSVLMATPASSTSEAKTSSQEIKGSKPCACEGCAELALVTLARFGMF